MKYVFSNQRNLREQGLNKVQNYINSQRIGATSSTRDKLLSGVLGIVSNTLGDKITRIALKSMQVLVTTIQALSSSNLSGQGNRYLDTVLGLIMERLGDNNPRVRESSESAAFQISTHSAIGPTPVAYKAIQGTKKKTGGNSSKLLCGRLRLLDLLVRQFPVNSKHGAVPPEKTVDFAINGYKNSNQDVRNIAYSLIMELYKKIGRGKFQPFLEEMRTAQQQNLVNGFNEIDGEKRPKKGAKIKTTKETKVQIVTHISPHGASGISPKSKASKKVAKPQQPKAAVKKQKSQFSEEEEQQQEYEQEEEVYQKPAINKKNQTLPPPPAHQADQSFEDYQDELADNAPEMQSISSKVCNFCHKFSEGFTSETLDLHYWKDCAMLTPCNYCGQVIEISNLTQHRLNQCQINFGECPRCSMAIPEEEYEEHVQMQMCKPSLPGSLNCPLCQTQIMPQNQDGWKRHILTVGCQNNPRHPSFQ